MARAVPICGTQMITSLENVVQQIHDTGLVAPGTLANFIPPKAIVQSVDELLRNLSKQHHLTKFQVALVGQGKAKALVLGSYTILDKIGAGGMGQVYQAEHRRMKRVVAIKTLPAAMMKDKSVVARFQREVEAAAKLNHPNIVTAYDADEGNGLHFLVMEHVQGTDLSALVKQQGPVPIDQAVNFLMQAARGLEYAHQKGVIHRDIKPANLLLEDNGTIKILDMGLARIDGTEHSPPPDDLTGTGAVMGTVDYMAPEQWANTHTADARCDLYALGCTLCFLLIGRAPYADDEHRNPVAKMRGHVQEPIPDLRIVRPDVPDRVLSIYKKLMAKNPDDRFPTATALIAALASISSNLTTETNTPVSPRATSSKTRITGTEAIQKAEDSNRTQITNEISLGSVAALIDTARQLFDAHDYAGVISLLENIPAQSRTEAMDSILENARECQAECARLLLEIDDARRLHKPKLLLTKAEQLLKLKPGHSPTRRLMKGLKSYGGKLETAKFDARDELLTLQEASGIFKGLGTYYIACIAAAAVAFGVGTALIYSYLGQSKVRQQLDVAVAKPPPDQLASQPKMASPERSDEGLASPSPTDPASTFKSPAFEEWIQKVTSMPAERQVEAVVKKLMELNQGFDGKVTDHGGKGTPGIENGVVTRLEIATDNVKDISPVRALVGLKRFACRGSVRSNGILSDLSPLKGMPSLTQLICANTLISDLSSLKDMRLTRLHCDDTRVTDLSPLRGMPLEILSCQSTKVSELSPLAGMPLTELFIDNTSVFDLSPLESCKSLATLKITNTKVTPARVAALQRVLPKCKIESDFSAMPMTPTNSITTFNDPEFQAWKRSVATLPAEEQIKAVVKKLRELNPEFDGTVSGWNGQGKPKVENAVVTELQFFTDHVTDISPVQALKGLRVLSCTGSDVGKGQLSDLSPLKGMKITTFRCCSNNIADLSPIEDIPLKFLDFGDTKVESLVPLRGMPLTNLLCWSTTVSDLSPLKGMLLSELVIHRTIRLSDIRPLKGMPLTLLNIGGTSVSDLSPLQGMPLKTLIFWGTKVPDLTPLREMHLNFLDCGVLPISDLSPIAGMPLRELRCSDTNVSDLKPLKGMPLQDLWVQNTQVSDLLPLQGMKLTKIFLTPKNITKGVGVIRRMKNLQTINIKRHLERPITPGEGSGRNTTLACSVSLPFPENSISLVSDRLKRCPSVNCARHQSRVGSGLGWWHLFHCPSCGQTFEADGGPPTPDESRSHRESV